MQRKVFRIEAMLPAKRHAPSASPAAGRRPADDNNHAADSDRAAEMQSLKAELIVMRDTITRNKCDLGNVLGDGTERRFARAGDELGAAIDGMQSATETILKLAEVADDSAKALAASLTDDYKRSVAQDIQDNLVKIFEACHFQDLAGQRIDKVMTMLSDIEAQVAATLARCNGIEAATQPPAKPTRSNDLLNGPKLAGDSGHATQHEIDRLFI